MIKCIIIKQEAIIGQDRIRIKQGKKIISRRVLILS